MIPRYDHVVAGAGITGLAVAKEVLRRDPGARMVVLDKEASTGRHASGRNSGVLHSGIYYPEGSLKARLCALGRARLEEYCRDRGLPLRVPGKVIVPVREEDDPQLELLLGRGLANGARVELVDEGGLRELEPTARSATGRALYSPDTGVVDPGAVLTALAGELSDSGVEIRLGEGVQRAEPERSLLHTDQGALAYGHFFNATGLHADRVARMFGAGLDYRTVPFRGVYFRLSPKSPIHPRLAIYPAPDLRVPFLGIHVTPTVDGDVHVGPSAFPALGRENYRGLWGAAPLEVPGILRSLGRLYLFNHDGFRNLVQTEARRLGRKGFARAVSELMPGVGPADLLPSKKVGLRAQLITRVDSRLLMDFVVERKRNSTHVLNVVSPGFTSALSFAEMVVAAVVEGDGTATVSGAEGVVPSRVPWQYLGGSSLPDGLEYRCSE